MTWKIFVKLFNSYFYFFKVPFAISLEGTGITGSSLLLKLYSLPCSVVALVGHMTGILIGICYACIFVKVCCV